MTDTTAPYTATRHSIGNARDGRPVTLTPTTADAAAALAPAIAAVGPWAHYGFGADALARALSPARDGVARYELAIADTGCGAIAIRMPWLAGPYLQMLAILPPFQNCGVGALVLDWYEQTARTAGLRNLWLCVTGINTDAQRFYRRHGFEEAARLPAILRAGDDELLMRKRLAD